MNLKEIIKNLFDISVTLDAENLMGDAAYLLDIREQLTPRSMDQKPEHEQWCLVFDKSGSCFVGKYIKPLDSFIDEIGIRKSPSFTWLPALEWKEDE